MSFDNPTFSMPNDDGIKTVQIKIEKDEGFTENLSRGSVMQFEDVSYAVETKAACCGSCRATTKKQILSNISGTFKPGLNAIMGPTGSGKSSLLDVLANRKDPEWLSGKVLLDGNPLPKNFHYHSGYVVQNNLLVSTITVRETLWFSANLRLPGSLSHKKKEARVESILSELGLTSCADSKIGDDVIRGISGGEKKRVSIAVELILQPQILFLDEPTTGLDAATACSVMKMLKKLGNLGHTIVFSIHQPRYRIFKLFDSLTLLSAGRLVYHGGSKETLPFFEEMGFTREAHDNPADFFLDVLNGVYQQSKEITENRSNQENAEAGDSDITEKLRRAFERSDQYKSTLNELKSLTGSAAKPTKISKNYATSFLHQLKILLGRTARNTLRDPQALLGNAFFNVIIGIVFGLIYYELDDSADTGIQNRLGVLFFICANLLFSSTMVIEIFSKEREIFIHEHISGYYRIISYFMAKILADLVPLRTISPIIFCSITYWMVGLKHDAGAFFIFLLISILTGYASVGVGLFYSTCFQTSLASVLLMLTFVLNILYSGLLVNLDTIMPWLSWLQYLSIARYGLNAFAVNELRGQEFSFCRNITKSFPTLASNINLPNSTNGILCKTTYGDHFLYEKLSIGTSHNLASDWDLWQNIVALCCITIGLYVLTYIQLIRARMYS